MARKYSAREVALIVDTFEWVLAKEHDREIDQLKAEVLSMDEWQSIESAPENQDVLVYRDQNGGEYGVDKFEWRTRSEDRLISERGNRRTYQTDEWKEQEWVNGWGWTHWMALPAPPNSGETKP